MSRRSGTARCSANATFVLEVSARRPLTEIQRNLPAFLKVGPNTKMNEIVHAHLPGVSLVHLPTPPPQIRAITDHVYFYFDRTSPLWPEFSVRRPRSACISQATGQSCRWSFGRSGKSGDDRPTTIRSAAATGRSFVPIRRAAHAAAAPAGAPPAARRPRRRVPAPPRRRAARRLSAAAACAAGPRLHPANGQADGTTGRADAAAPNNPYVAAEAARRR